MKIVITVIVSVVLTLALAGYVVHRGYGNLTPKIPPTPVRIETVARGQLIELVTATGEIEPMNKVSLSAKVSARITSLPFPEGSRVYKGDPATTQPATPSVLVKLDARDLESALRSAEARYAAQGANLTVAEARVAAQEAQNKVMKVQLTDAMRDLKRQKGLFESNDVSAMVLEAAQTKVDQFDAQIASADFSLAADKANLVVMRHNLEAAEADIAKARDDLSYTTITSPLDGIVTRVNAKEGELVVTGTMNNAGTVILEVADLDTMVLNAKVDESVIAQLKVGQRGKVTIPAYKNETFDGTVRLIALAHTEAKDGTRYYKTEILLKTVGRRIYSGLNADVDIETARHDNVLTIPSQAVLGRPVDDLPMSVRNNKEVDATRTFTTVVYRMINGKAVVTPVKIGPSDLTHTMIESGLSEGDQVIIGPYKVLEALANDQGVVDEKAAPATTAPATSGAK